MQQPLNPQALWSKVKSEMIRRLDFNLSLADALNAARLITVDDNTLVLGFSQEEMHNSGILLAPDKKNTIEKILEEQTGHPMSYLLIQGTSTKDWDLIKSRRDTVSAHIEEGFRDRKQQSAIASSLDEVSQELHRRYSALPGRAFAQVKAKWVLEIIPVIVEAEERLHSDDETFVRQFARVIDKVASMTDIPAAVIALEMERFKRDRDKSG